MNSDPQIVSILSQMAGIVILIASVVLWLRRRTPWLLLAMIAQIVGMLCRAVVTLWPALYVQLVPLHFVWALAAAAFGVGLLCHALLETPATPASAAPSDPSP